MTSDIARYNNQEITFSAADSGLPGFVLLANLRHWWTTNKRPHLWLAAEAPPAESMAQEAYEAWLDSRKHDGFTHIVFTVASGGRANKALGPDNHPNEGYFSALDDRLLAAAARGFTLDLILADASGIQASGGAFDNFETRDALVGYIVARYGAWNVTWQGIGSFEDVPSSRPLLKALAESLDRYDVYRHPRSSDARVTSSPLLLDRWMNFVIESSNDPALGAVEHQFTQVPQIHRITSTEPTAFRHELWNATTNGEYPSVSYAALQNTANVKAIQVWSSVMADTRHWELEPYFDVDGARSVGLDEVEYLVYAEKPTIVEVTLPKHKYNPVWINPATGENIDLKDYKGEVFSRQTPDNSHDWVLQVPREGHKEMMLRSYRFESQDPPVQEPELDPTRTPFDIADPTGDGFLASAPPPYSLKLTRSNRATRSMSYVWWGEIVGGSEGSRVLGLGTHGTFQMPAAFQQPGSTLNVKLQAINANGKAYEIDRVFQLTQ